MYAAKGNAPHYYVFGGDIPKTPRSVDFRDDSLMGKRKRCYYSFIFETIITENPEFNYEVLATAIRELWRVNGKKVVTIHSLESVIESAKALYKSKVNRIKYLCKLLSLSDDDEEKKKIMCKFKEMIGKEFDPKSLIGEANNE
jgi:hypothetical protein